MDTGRSKFIDDLVDLLVRMGHGMTEFDEPLPESVYDHILLAVAGFGSEILPKLHHILQEQKAEDDLIYLIDALGKIGDATSIPYLIDKHANYSSFMGGMAALRALQAIGTDASYLYFADLISRYVDGERHMINSDREITVICEALGDWGNVRAIPILERAAQIHNHTGLPKSQSNNWRNIHNPQLFFRKSDSSYG